MLTLFSTILLVLCLVVAGIIFVKAKEKVTKGSVLSLLLGLLIFGGGIAVNPHYNVWVQGLEGSAELARAEQNRQIRINEAKAKLDAAEHEANAEIERARGVKEANDIIAEGLGGPEGYLRYLYIDMLRETGGQGRETIYIPTEAGIPILEAGRVK